MQMHTFFRRAFLTGALLSITALSLVSGWTADRGNIVVFDANWCATCREVVPIVREIAGQNRLGVILIDVDSQSAPKQARNLGISVPSDEPPQVFYSSSGRVRLLYNGRGAKYGSSNTIRSQILQNLQQLQ